MAPVTQRGQSTGPLVARVSAAGVALVFVVIVSSAFLRLVRVGVGCEDWPACYGAPLATALLPVAPAVRWMQVVHLIAAAGVGLIALVTVALALGDARRRDVQVASGLIVSLTLFLAVIGRIFPGAPLPAVTLGNVLGGTALMAAFAWLWLGYAAPTVAGPPRRLRAAAGAALALLGLQITLGTLLSSNFAALACGGADGCSALPAEWSFAAFDPFRVPDPPVAGVAQDAARRVLHLAHRWTGALAAAVFLGLATMLWRTGGAGARGVACALAGLPFVQAGLGLTLVRLEVPLVAAVAHAGTSALLALAATAALHYSSSAEAAAVSTACQTETSNQPPGT